MKHTCRTKAKVKKGIIWNFNLLEHTIMLGWSIDIDFYLSTSGFCKNDKMHDVYLLVEAYVQPKNGGKSRKVGEGKFAIYPRPNAPRIKANVDPGEDFYRYTDILSLLRTVSTDSVQMHCGRIRCTYALRRCCHLSHPHQYVHHLQRRKSRPDVTCQDIRQTPLLDFLPMHHGKTKSRITSRYTCLLHPHCHPLLTAKRLL